jgi:hypothetical protein
MYSPLVESVRSYVQRSRKPTRCYDTMLLRLALRSPDSSAARARHQSDAVAARQPRPPPLVLKVLPLRVRLPRPRRAHTPERSQ